jgi:hypothetical protein
MRRRAQRRFAVFVRFLTRFFARGFFGEDCGAGAAAGRLVSAAKPRRVSQRETAARICGAVRSSVSAWPARRCSYSVTSGLAV